MHYLPRRSALRASSPRFRLLYWLLPLLMGWQSGCTPDTRANTDAQPRTLPEVPVTTLRARDTVMRHEYVADIQAVRNVEIRARVEGYLKQIFVDEGQTVRKDQPLFQIDDAPYRTQLARARAERHNAEAQTRVARLELTRVRLLVEKNIIVQTEMEVAQAKLAAAQANVEQARAAETVAEQHLTYTLVRAPFDGIVDRIPLKMGSLIAEGTLLTITSDLSAIYAYFSVSEAEYLEYRKARLQDSARAANQAHLVLANGTEYPLSGRIETVGGEFESTTGSISFRSRFANPNRLLKHGATGKVRITNTEHAAVLVPQKAAFDIQDKTYVYVLDERNRVKMRAFKPEARLGRYYLVGEGLKPGDRVVVEGVQSLRDGAQVTPRVVAMSQLLNEAQ